MGQEDFKAAFRAKVKSAKPSKEQLRALKAKKSAAAAEQEAVRVTASEKERQEPQQFRVPAPRAPRAGTGPQAPPAPPQPSAPASTALPSGFFDYADDTPSTSKSEGAAPRPMEVTVHAQRNGDVSGRGQLPEGFYADKAADEKARGVAVKKRSLEEEMADFQASVAEDLRAAEMAEQEEAEQMAREKEDREAYEHEMRKQKVSELRSLVKTGPKPKGLGQRIETTGKSKRQKTLDLLAGVVSDDDEENTSEDDDNLLDWRAKGV